MFTSTSKSTVYLNIYLYLYIYFYLHIHLYIYLYILLYLFHYFVFTRNVVFTHVSDHATAKGKTPSTIINVQAHGTPKEPHRTL